mmetsp:Transcript_9373/g.14463  ORF Transcript_9373/g.14463 Transcript_9373/m.14463 type:complete len:344 (-) Transcript_9373:55-1086(-)
MGMTLNPLHKSESSKVSYAVMDETDLIILSDNILEEKSREIRSQCFLRRKVAAWILFVFFLKISYFYCLAEEKIQPTNGRSFQSIFTSVKFPQSLASRKNEKQQGMVESLHNENSNNEGNKRQMSHLNKAAKDFAATLPKRNENDIALQSLLLACQSFVSFLQKTAPSAVARDFENNLRKIEKSTTVAKIGRKVSLSAFLKAERDSEIHSRRHSRSYTLRDPSGAVGLLWMRRSLAFQSDIYQHLLDGSSPKHAALSAYARQLEPYHGWSLRKFYTLFLSTNMPSTRDSMLEKIGGGIHHEFTPQKRQQTLSEMKSLLKVWEPLLKGWTQAFVELEMEDSRKV